MTPHTPPFPCPPQVGSAAAELQGLLRQGREFAEVLLELPVRSAATSASPNAPASGERGTLVLRLLNIGRVPAAAAAPQKTPAAAVAAAMAAAAAAPAPRPGGKVRRATVGRVLRGCMSMSAFYIPFPALIQPLILVTLLN